MARAHRYHSARRPRLFAALLVGGVVAGSFLGFLSTIDFLVIGIARPAEVANLVASRMFWSVVLGAFPAALLSFLAVSYAVDAGKLRHPYALLAVGPAITTIGTLYLGVWGPFYYVAMLLPLLVGYPAFVASARIVKVFKVEREG